MCIQELIEIGTVVLEMSHHPSIDIYIYGLILSGV